MREMMQRLENECVMRTAVARDNFAQFCELNGNSITDRPQFKGSVSASWREEIGEADHRLVFCTRHYDLVILGHPTGPNGLPPDLLERLLLGSGRPLLIAPPRVSEQLLGTVMVCWKGNGGGDACGRCRKCRSWPKRSTSFSHASKKTTYGLADLARQLAWHGISAEIEFLPSAAGAAGEMLIATARSHEADLLVMGGYGHSRLREFILGGATRAILSSMTVPTLMSH